MSFVDLITITAQSGNGGNGKKSFRKEKYVPKGGPNGGNGGDGGHIIIQSSSRVSTFMDLSPQKIYKAGHGDDGGTLNKTGKNGSNTIITVPQGTIIRDAETNDVIADVTDDNATIVLLRGGKGGKGNQEFATARIQAPTKTTPGKPGIKQTFIFELKIMADIGLIGYPNAGKSTLLKTLTNANAKIGNYPFTTKQPNLGVFKQFDREIVIADIPGIIDGASKGLGLGNTFLRHISRTSTLLFLIEPDPDNINHAVESYQALCHELNEYSPDTLTTKNYGIVINKMDLISTDAMDQITAMFKQHQQSVQFISCMTMQGIEALKKDVCKQCNNNNESL